MDLNKVLKKNSEVVAREIEGEMILVPLYKSADDLSYIYTLNETAAAAWNLIDGKRTLAQIKDELADEYETEDINLSQKLEELVKDLKSVKAVI